MVQATMVSSMIRNVDKQTFPNFGVKEHSQRSFRNQTSVNNEQYHEVSGVANLRENLAL